MATSLIQNINTSGQDTIAPVTDVHQGLAQIAQQHNVDISGDGNVNLKDKFWDYATIDGTRWNNLFPYRLAIYKRSGDSWVFDSNTIHPFTLPIPPEELSISTPFAIVTTVTLGGIVEEHNGAPLRMITLSGTTGVFPLRGTPGTPPIGTSIAGGIITSTSTSLNGAIVNKTISQLNNNIHPYGVVSDFSGDIGKGTGYYQFQLLKKFLESYVALKKTTIGRDYILVFEMWKDQSAYLVSPVSFDLRRSQSAPLEYQYAIQLKAWRRINIPVKSGASTAIDLSGQLKSKVAAALSALSDARVSLENSRDSLTSIQENIAQTLFTPVREAILFCKDVLGVTLTAVDLPSNILTELQEPILESISIGNALPTILSQTAQSISDAFSALSISSSKSESGGGRIVHPSNPVNGASPAIKVSQDPTKAFEFYQSIIPSKLNVRSSTKAKIDSEKSRVRKLKREDFEVRRDSVQSVINSIQDAVGAGNSTYSKTYGLIPKVTTRTPTDLDFDLLFTLNETLLQFNTLAASSNINQDEISAMDFFAGLASQSGIAFTVPTSKFLVPFPFGHTLEQLSLLYLGTPDRWFEIAALNGLQSPYVDEVGFILSLLTNGIDNTVTISDATNLYVNQAVWIGSTVVNRTKRHITKIVQLDTNFFTVTVDGDPTLNQYLVSDGATLQAFLPNTVNSQMSLFIPSSDAADENDYRTKSIPGVSYFDPLVRIGGIDILLSNTGDLVVTPDGDTKLAVGLTNIVQKVRLVLGTLRGTLLHHPDYGFPFQVGGSVADITAQDVLKAAQGIFADDPSFSGVESATILLNSPVLSITITVGIAGTSTLIPISVIIPK